MLIHLTFSRMLRVHAPKRRTKAPPLQCETKNHWQLKSPENTFQKLAKGACVILLCIYLLRAVVPVFKQQRSRCGIRDELASRRRL